MESALKAIILAAGSQSMRADGSPILLEQLGEQRVIDAVLNNILTLVKKEDIYLVVGSFAEAFKQHLGDSMQYVHQPTPSGTGHAVALVAPLLHGYEGDLLIVYGDTPLFSAVSLRGLLNHHRQTGADLSLLTAISEEVYPYGHIIRNNSGRIRDLVEHEQANTYERDIRELNLGAYAVDSSRLFQALAARHADQELALTEIVSEFAQRNWHIGSYQVYDQDEIQGINNREDLEKAAFVVKKRHFLRQEHEETNQVQFGTGGWRAVIGEGFTMFNVRRLSQAIANQMQRERQQAQGVLIGFDHRFLSNYAARAAAEIFAGNNIPVQLLTEAAPTPLVEFAALEAGVAYGMVFTASHNAPEWNGLKVFHGNGGLLMTEETNQLEQEANLLTSQRLVRVSFETARQAGVIHYCDYTNAYVDQVASFVDMEAIKQAALRLVVDPMFGVGRLTLGILLNDARCRVTFINERHNPLFGGRSPTPDFNALRLLMAHVRDGNYDLGLAMDGDADRIALINEQGEFIEVNDILLLLYWYLHEHKGLRGAVVRNVATTHLLDKLAQHYDEEAIETPVGFKWIGDAIIHHDALMGGESSGGMTIRGHIRGKDGILASMLLIEMVAKTGKPISALLEEVWQLTGCAHMVETNLPATADMRVVVPQRLAELIEGGDLPWNVRELRQDDGTKIIFENDKWLLLRFSGTEPVLRIFSEAPTLESAQEMADWLVHEINP
jgi:phosphomannomutase/CTP:molybdopterin cytidylyltransferase MocA